MLWKNSLRGAVGRGLLGPLARADVDRGRKARIR